MDLCDVDEANSTVTKCNHCNRICLTNDEHKALVSQTDEIRDLKQQLKSQTEAFERLQLDISTLNKKYVAAIERVADVQHEKDLVEHELEELSRKLFEEANGMVATEKREKWELENQLRQTQEYLVSEQSQLTELKERMQAMLVSEDLSPAQNQNDPRTRAQNDLQELYGVKRASTNPTLYRKNISSDPTQRVTSMPPLQSQPRIQRMVTIDEFQLNKFQEYINSSRSVSVKKLSQFAYLKYCQAEDIEPCLRFGPQSRLSVKKMMDYLMRQPCFIEQMPLDDNVAPKSTLVTPISITTQRPLWERFSNSKILDGGCSACGRSAGQDCALKYRFKLDSSDPWLPIDEYCRDRLVAVCEFYVFLRNIQLGLYSDRPVQDLYAENIRLRLQMFYSRMGALPVMLEGMGMSPDTIGKASVPLETLATIPDDAYTSDTSASSGPCTPIRTNLSILSSVAYQNEPWALDSSQSQPP
ncbi:hypothetical protein J3Q64DRAFT_1838776 [Phycomyces blakesleeanus]|uniref:GDP/GTP exchange factor Sec2 N-terminal domain-containing protein n=2 Tax=Phycomyces blakesleeanus TaxID=4837 RepID=A0A167KVQ0_PHYB8|nr:hypothetical protein PHYBLDRAFT_67095 [Phycomyces blakesleeanus NRRL 1555(-)]OAD68999.1 hypothetical protein PHYBLDRAFT_67095 [Phycomyces blakesleeanus NRRL 1555(-)]|eukprot:XP_018287039.1 hypothetical protein PHYBLDRAFT_67095 [Phycomyces blakesleeanus NRRL 1555(-)]